MKKCDFEGRRRLLIGGVSATVVTLYLAAVGRGALKSCGIDDLDVGLAELRPFIRVGNAYLAELLASGQSTLRDDLLNLFPRRSIRQADSVRRQLRAIGRQVEEEFERGDTVSCDGWVLARSEARLCAAAAIQFGERDAVAPRGFQRDRTRIDS